MAVGVDVLRFHPVVVDQARQYLIGFSEVALECLARRKFLPSLGFQRFGVVAEEVAQRLVYRLVPSIGSHYAHADGRVVHQSAVAFVGFGPTVACLVGVLLQADLVIDHPERDRQTVRFSA